MTQSVHEYSGGADPYYNWLTQSRLDTFADQSASSSIDSAQSSLLFTIGRSSSRPRPQQPPVGPDFGKDRLGAGRSVDQVDAARKCVFLGAIVTICHLSLSETRVYCDKMAAAWITQLSAKIT